MNDFDKLNEAMDQVEDRYLKEAGAARKIKRRLPWLGAMAAALALVIFLSGVLPSAVPGGTTLPTSSGLLPSTPPNDPTLPTSSGLQPPALSAAQLVSPASGARRQSIQARLDNQSLISDTKGLLASFFAGSNRLILGGTTENRVWSPVSAYTALAMTAQLAARDTRQQILTVLGAEDLDALADQVSAVWENVYLGGSYSKSVLASAVWLDEGQPFDQSAMDALAHDHYASVYQADLGTDGADAAIRDWLNENTGKLLENAVSGIDLPEDTVMALYSTIWFQAKWSDEFNPNSNTDRAFQAPGGTITCTFMNKKEETMTYYWGEDFSAVWLYLVNGSKMWFILPDEDKTLDDVLQQGEYLDLVMEMRDWPDQTQVRVNLSVPKFDISTQLGLDETLQSLGVTDAFDPHAADFSTALPGGTAWLQGVNQATRVAIDEEGVTAASYTEEPAVGAMPPPEEIVDFILNRPFLFVITKEDVPLFTGVVNEP